MFFSSKKLRFSKISNKMVVAELLMVNNYSKLLTFKHCWHVKTQLFIRLCDQQIPHKILRNSYYGFTSQLRNVSIESENHTGMERFELTEKQGTPGIISFIVCILQ